jgi:DUF1009 family protein
MPVRSGGVRTVQQRSSKTLGLIAGTGTLPCIIASEAKKRGFRVIVIALQPPADETLRPLADHFHKVHIGRFGEVIKTLRRSSVNEVVMAGKVPKTLLYQDKKSLIPDVRALKILFSLKDRSDSAFMDAIRTEIEKEGMKLIKATSFIKDMMTTEGVLTKKQPKKSQWNDISYGWKIAKGIGSLDIGQTVVIKGTAVMAVEAIEGTDEAILRGGGLAGNDAVVVKVFKPKQDARLDVPVVGIDTLSTMKQAGAKVLALEAKKSIILDKDDFIKEADQAGIIVVGVTADRVEE